MNNIPPPHREAGFTLAELLVVMVVLSLLAAAMAPQIMGRLNKSKIRAAKLQLETVATSVDLFQLDVGRVPTPQEGLKSLIQKPPNLKNWDGPYVRSAQTLIDPWDRPFIYNGNFGNLPYQLTTLGADGSPGGDGENADLSFPNYDIPANFGN